MTRRARWFVLITLASCAKQINGPSPSLSAVSPSVACNDQAATVIALSGAGLSPLNVQTLRTPKLELPAITLLPQTALDGSVATTTAVTIPDDPLHPEISDVSWTSLESMSFSLCPPGTCSAQTPARTDLATMPNPALYSVKVANRNGRAVTFANSLVVVPPPILNSESVDLLCQDDDNQVTFSGDNFYSLNGQPVNISVGSRSFTPTLEACRTLPAPQGITLQACQTAHITIPAKTFTAGTQPVRVIGPGSIDCHSTNPLTITFVPEPTLQSVVPDLLCDAQGNRQITLNGAGFLAIDSVLPTIHIGSQSFSASTAGGCTSVTGPHEVVQSCTTLTLALPQNTLAPQSADVTVTNPPPADCTTHPAVNLTVLPAPTLTQVVSDLACNAQGTTTFTLTGTGFVTVGAATPSVVLSDATQTAATLPSTPVAASCTPIVGPVETAQSCTQMTVDVPEDTLAAGAYTFTLTNPEPVGCSTTEPLTTLIIPPPTVTSTGPVPLCTAQGAVEYNVTGTGFLLVGIVTPTVTLTADGGTPLELPATIDAASCTPIADVSETAALCTGLSISVPKDALAVGTRYALVVTNPAPASCASIEAASLIGAAPPIITDVTPLALCRGGGQITLTGSNFLAGTTVSIGPLQTTSLTVNELGTSLTAQVGAGLTSNNSYPVTLSDGAGCLATATQEIAIADGPQIFFVDPPTVWNGAATQVTIYGSHVTPPYHTVSIIPSGGGSAITLTPVLDPLHEHRVHATIPAGTAAGTYDVLVTDSSPCPAVLTAGLKIVNTTSFTNLTVTPDTGYSGVNTSVQIKSSGQFQAIPRAYLTPSGGTGGTATALTSLSYIDNSTLAAVVPQGALQTGAYDLILVNPDGSVGVQIAPFTVVPNPSPIITTLSPGQVNFQTAQTFQVQGQNFQTGASVALSCVDPNGASFAAPPLTQASCGAGQDATCIAVTLTINNAGACVVSVTNPDGGHFDFSSLVVLNPAVKLNAFHSATSMTEGRRALAIATAQATPSARFLYAFGGDDGTEANAKKTIEAATVDVFGHLGNWFRLPNAMLHPRTFVGGVSVGRFIYAVGGSDGTGATSSVERAAVLDPTSVPAIEDLDLAEGNGQGLSAGLYVYRVAPVMADSDPFNPGGEGLASDPFVVQVPNLTTKVQLTLSWNAFPGVKPCSGSPTTPAACGYRVYRSPAANATPGSEVLIADNVPSTSLADTGLTPLLLDNASVKPLPVGATGVWTPVATLGTARSGAAVTAIVDPANPLVSYLYAMGGNTGTEAMPAIVASTEYLTITTAGDGSQSFGSWTPGPGLGAARWQAGAFSMNLGATNYLWVGAGLTATGLSRDVDGATIGSNGLPGSFTSPTQMDSRAGYAPVAVNGMLFAIGGGDNAPSTSARQTKISTAPGLNNWTSATVSLNEARLLPASTVQSGFIFLCGGRSDPTNANATSSCESTIW